MADPTYRRFYSERYPDDTEIAEAISSSFKKKRIPEVKLQTEHGDFSYGKGRISWEKDTNKVSIKKKPGGAYVEFKKKFK